MSQREDDRIAVTPEELAILADVKATANGLKLSVIDQDDKHFRLTYSVNDRLKWCVDLWPSVDEWNRVAWHPEHRGPVLQLPRFWTILDAVNAMIAAKDGTVAGVKPNRKRPKPRLRRR